MSETASKGGLTLTKVSILVFVLILLILCKDDIVKLNHKIQLRLGRERPVFTANAWQRWNFGAMSLETPFPFKSFLDPALQPPTFRIVFNDFEDFEASDPYDCFHVAVSGATLKPNLHLDLDLFIRGAMTGLLQRYGDKNPIYTSEPMNSGGTELRRIHYRKEGHTRTVHMDGVFAKRGQKTWLVMVAYFADDAAPDAQRIINSLQVSNNVR